MYTGLQGRCKDKLTPPPPPPLQKEKENTYYTHLGNVYWLTKAIRNSESLALSLKTSAHRTLHWVSEYQPWLPLAKNIYFEQVLWVIVCPLQIFWPVIIVQSIPLILPILLKWKIKNLLLITFDPLLTYYTPSLFGFCIFILHNEWKNFTIVFTIEG